MIRHIVAWTLSGEFNKHEKQHHAAKIKEELEKLPNVIDGIVSLKVYISLLESSNCDILLDSTFKDENSLKNYQNHPEHKQIGQFMKSVIADRKCADFIE